MTTYVKVRWHHDDDADPIVLFHEIGEGQRELRRVELFEDGRLLRSDKVEPDAPVSLSVEPLPSIDEIRTQLQFSVVEIDAAGFNAVWDRADEARG